MLPNAKVCAKVCDELLLSSTYFFVAKFKSEVGAIPDTKLPKVPPLAFDTKSVGNV